MPAIPTASEAGGKSVMMSGTSYKLMLAGLRTSLFISPVTVCIVGILCDVFLLICIHVGESLPENDKVRVRAQRTIEVLGGTCKFASAPPNATVPTPLIPSGVWQNQHLCVLNVVIHIPSPVPSAPSVVPPVTPVSAAAPMSAAPVSTAPRPRVRKAHPTVDLERVHSHNILLSPLNQPTLAFISDVRVDFTKKDGVPSNVVIPRGTDATTAHARVIAALGLSANYSELSFYVLPYEKKSKMSRLDSNEAMLGALARWDAAADRVLTNTPTIRIYDILVCC